MKKCIIILLIFCLTIVFTSCKLNINEEVLDNISDIRYNLFEAKAENVTANIMCGMRENPYNYDGISNKKCEFGVITVLFKQKPDMETISFTLKINNSTIEGTLEENPYDHSFMFDIEQLIADTDTVYLSLENYNNSFLMNCVSNSWNVQYNDALNIALETLKEDLPKYFVKKKFSAECYLKIIFDNKTNLSPFFWFFGIIDTNGNSTNILINTETGNIEAQN